MALALWAAIALCVVSGALCGLLNGFLTIRFRLPSFIVTLGLMEAARGATYLVTNSQTMYIGSAIEILDNLTLFGLSMPFLVAICCAIIAQCVLTGSVFGRYAIALGTNEEAVRLSGIDTRPIKLAVFTLSGALAAVAGVSYCAQLSSADPNAGNGFELAAIAAVVIGGTSLMGGRGSVINSLFGVLVISVLETGIGCICGPRNLTSAKERLQGYEDALTEARLSVDTKLIHPGDFHIEGGYAAVQALLDIPNRITAVFAANDLMAMGALRGIADRGLRIPDDVAVVGFDGIALSRYTQPPLTTMAQPIREIAKLATQLVLARVNGGRKISQTHRLKTSLVVRESCGIEPPAESRPRAKQMKKR